MSKRILLFSLSQGGGTVRAAQAIELAFQQLEAGAMVAHVDVLQLEHAGFLRRAVKTGLQAAGKRAVRNPDRVSYGYELSDQPGGGGRIPLSDRIRLWPRRRFIHFGVSLVNRDLTQLLLSEPWDCVVSTVTFPFRAIASLKRQGKWQTPSYMVTTDFVPHRSCVSRTPDHYFTATEEWAAYLETHGVSADTVSATGIPIHPKFVQSRDRDRCLKSLGLTGDRPVLVFLAGGIGSFPVSMYLAEKVFRAVLAIEMPLDIVVVTGHCQTLQQQFGKISVPPKHRVKLLGFTDRMDELLSVAEVVVSKPGGITSAEVLARGAAMVIVYPLHGGPEMRNGDFLLENGAAIKIHNPATLPYKIAQLLGDPNRLALLRTNARRLARPQAAFDVVRHVLGQVIETEQT